MAILYKSDNVAISFIHRQPAALKPRFGNDNLNSPSLSAIFTALGAHVACAPRGYHRALYRDDNITKAFAPEYWLDVEMWFTQMRLKWAFRLCGLKRPRQQTAGKQKGAD